MPLKCMFNLMSDELKRGTQAGVTFTSFHFSHLKREFETSNAIRNRHKDNLTKRRIDGRKNNQSVKNISFFFWVHFTHPRHPHHPCTHTLLTCIQTDP